MQFKYDTEELTAEYVNLSGFKLRVIAERILCDDPRLIPMYNDIEHAISAKLHTIGAIREIERKYGGLPEVIFSDDDPDYDSKVEDSIDQAIALDEHRHHVEWVYKEMQLGDTIDYDYDTGEYKVNGGEWCCAYSGDLDGGSTEYPTLRDMTESEIGPLYNLIREINAGSIACIGIQTIAYDKESELELTAPMPSFR